MTTLYLHGFCSSPVSQKARALKAAHEKAGIPFIAPAMHCGPLKAMAMIDEQIKGVDPSELLVVGSSLGGFYAARVADRLGAKAILLNPAVLAWDVIGQYIGKHPVPDADITIEVTPAHIDELRTLEVRTLKRPEDFLVILGTADEVLDWHDAAKRYADSKQIIIPGADHRFSDFDPVLELIMERARSVCTHS